MYLSSEQMFRRRLAKSKDKNFQAFPFQLRNFFKKVNIFATNVPKDYMLSSREKKSAVLLEYTCPWLPQNLARDGFFTFECT